MIKLKVCNDAVLVWNSEDICILREKYHIVGALIGLHPRKPHQLRMSHVPLRLMPEEAKLLVDKGIAQLFHSPEETPDQSVIDDYYEKRDKFCIDQIALNKEHRIKEIQMKCTDANVADITKVKELSKEDTMVQIFTECPWKTHIPAGIPCKYPSTPEEKLKYAVYKDLWEKNFYITNGSKFGGDFLVYAGDPKMFHALYIIVCLAQLRKIKGLDIICYGRLAHQVKKTFAFASFNEKEEVEYVSISYMPDSPTEKNNEEA